MLHEQKLKSGGMMTEKDLSRTYTCWKHRDGGYLDLSHYTKTKIHVKKRIKLPKEFFE